MNVEILASGSTGNAYVFSDGGFKILVECGLPYKKLMEKLNHDLPHALVVTHEHGDHAKSAPKLLETGIPVYMTRGTANALELVRHNLNIIEANRPFWIRDHEFLPIKTFHDAAEPVCFIIDREILFVTDTGKMPRVTGTFKKILIEANYDRNTLQYSKTARRLKNRIFRSHLSVYQATDFLQTIDEPDEVWLIHISKRNGDAVEFVKQVKRDTGFKNVFAG